ncbi:MAG: FAD-binding oxidoreductase [Hyphomicrobiales bacterium]|nr:FAD-binding oxidoreductase [Hyphomicrobiales bacterium]
MVTRRKFILGTGAAAALPLDGLSAQTGAERAGRDLLAVNDVHSKLNPTRLHRIETPAGLEDLRAAIAGARAEGKAICIAGGRHAMGGQQFLAGGVMIDTRRLRKVLAFDAEAGIIEVEAGIQWPQLIGHLNRLQAGQPRQWAIAQKQSGADRLTIGGALAANAHGRGLTMQPFISDVESFTLVDGDGDMRTCSRRENAELFRLAIGGYGLFGVIYSVRMRLVWRRKLRRVVEILNSEDVMPAFERRIADGFLYGDFQFDINERSDGFLRRGVFSCYEPVDAATPVPPAQAELSEADWRGLIALAHTDKQRAFDIYAGHYMKTSGQIYWSDTHQLSIYVDDYHTALDRLTGARDPATELITEIYVPRTELPSFMADAAADFRRHTTQLIYGTVRLIERDGESVLAWARQPYACVIFNLHIVHNSLRRTQAADAFRRLIDRAIERDGSYFLTYHRYADRAQVEACYPQMPEFLKLKRQYDPAGVFQSDWYRHYAAMFAGRP